LRRTGTAFRQALNEAWLGLGKGGNHCLGYGFLCLIINNATINTTTTTATTTAKAGTALGVGLVYVDVVGVVTELIEVLLVETLVDIILTVPEPALVT
jgi:hypothetical protein